MQESSSSAGNQTDFQLGSDYDDKEKDIHALLHVGGLRVIF
jgi:hypothetical protein